MKIKDKEVKYVEQRQTETYLKILTVTETSLQIDFKSCISI